MKKYIRVVVGIIMTLLFSTGVCVASSWTHDEEPYSIYSQDAVLFTGEGINKEKIFTVSDLESMTEQVTTAIYTMNSDHGCDTSQWQGIPVGYLLQQCEPNRKAKYIRVVSQDGCTGIFTYEEIASQTYINNVGQTGLKAIIAYGKDEYPLVKESRGPGFNGLVRNSGGPLRLVVGQTDEKDENAGKFLKNIVRVEVLESGERTEFTDLGAEYDWAKDSIYKLFDSGVINGVGESRFAPENNVKRSEYSKMIVLALKLDLNTGSEATFKDVSKAYWGASYIDAAVKYGLMKGTGNGNFRPEANISRNELAVLAVRAAGRETEALADNGESLLFKDKNDIPDWAKGSVAKAVEMGLFQDIAGETFNGNQPATRAEAAVITARTIACSGK